MGLFGWFSGKSSNSSNSSTQKRTRSTSEQRRFRKAALENAARDKYGNIQDIYTGRYHKAKSMEADHIFPHSKGGPNAAWNSAMTHKKYNNAKRDNIRTADLAKGYSRNKQVRNTAKKAAAVGAMAAIASSFDF